MRVHGGRGGGKKNHTKKTKHTISHFIKKCSYRVKSPAQTKTRRNRNTGLLSQSYLSSKLGTGTLYEYYSDNGKL